MLVQLVQQELDQRVSLLRQMHLRTRKLVLRRPRVQPLRPRHPISPGRTVLVLEADHWAPVAGQLARKHLYRSPASQRRVKKLPEPRELVLEQRARREPQEQEPISFAQLTQRGIRPPKLSSTAALTSVES